MPSDLLSSAQKNPVELQASARRDIVLSVRALHLQESKRLIAHPKGHRRRHQEMLLGTDDSHSPKNQKDSPSGGYYRMLAGS